jgi:antitoxin component YwqK of YwqJK toxin-antitoxin module
LQELFYKDGLLEGLQKIYYKGGALQGELSYQKGVISGPIKLYFPNGQIMREMTLVAARRQGLDTLWDSTGSIAFSLEYDRGRFTKAFIEDTIAKVYQL